jgi:hypothetical protein
MEAGGDAGAGSGLEKFGIASTAAARLKAREWSEAEAPLSIHFAKRPICLYPQRKIHPRRLHSATPTS